MTSTTSKIAAAAFAAAFLAACGGQGGVTPRTSTQRPIPGSPRAKKDISAADLHAGGGAFPMEVYNGDQQPVGQYPNPSQQQPTTVSLFFNYPSTTANIYYCQTGSDFGKGIYTGTNTGGSTAACANEGVAATGFGGEVDPPDFVGTDVPFSAADNTAYQANRQFSHGNPAEIPTVAGPIDYTYNTGDLTGLGAKTLKLSRWSYCAISNGTVKDWNDSAITADNGGVSVTGGTSLPITFVYRSDQDGTNLTLQRHLGIVCGSSWTGVYASAPYQSTGRSAKWTGGAASETWTGPTTGNFVAAYGPDAQISTITSTTGGAGAVDGPLATAQGLGTALLQNQAAAFIDPTNSTALKASVSHMLVRLGSTDGGATGAPNSACIAYVPPYTYDNPSVSNAYPIMELSYVLAYQKNNLHFANLVTLLKYIDRIYSSPPAGSADAVILQNGYVPLDTSMKSYVSHMLSGSTNCITS
ncbi:MAG TPA: substrate-binding domain-containing protein [Candidatus Baltobacteraceae bacterium]|jgi:ABC-type phosphate transport system substrate-binding protein|nr:substrate-binding domain-containing protein [Candidatus Baltobacteraceae bacterium]